MGIYIASAEETAKGKLSGRGTLRASARAVVIARAVGKRLAGSLVRLRNRTRVRGGGILGLKRAGGVGVALTCCASRADGLSA